MFRCVIMRGGTSRALFFKANELPADPGKRDRVLLAALGSPDPRQIDGLGGADLLTSKVAIIAPSGRKDADVDFTFAQVAVDRPQVDYTANCGNISAAVGPYAVDEGLVKAVEPVTRVRIYSTNTGSIFVAHVPVREGKAAVEGSCQIDGVPGTGAGIDLDFAGSVGTAKGGLLPTGKPYDLLNVPETGTVKVSIVDLGNCVAFVSAAEAGLTGAASPTEIAGNKALLARLETIRGAAARLLGFAETIAEAAARSPARPFLGLVFPPAPYQDYITGRIIGTSEIDVRCTIFAMQKIHKTYPVTGAVCTGAAACITGTVVNDLFNKNRPQAGIIRIGHPSGIIEAEIVMQQKDGGYIVEKASVSRTARRIMEGYLFVRKSILDAEKQEEENV